MCMSQVSLDWNTSAGWRPSCFFASWSEADEIIWLWPCPSVELQDCLLSGQPSTDMRSAWKTTPNNFLLSEASNLKTFLLGELRSSFWFYFPSYTTVTWFSITVIILCWIALLKWKPALSRRCAKHVSNHKQMHKYIRMYLYIPMCITYVHESIYVCVKTDYRFTEGKISVSQNVTCRYFLDYMYTRIQAFFPAKIELLKCRRWN